MHSKIFRKQLFEDFIAWQRDDSASVSTGLQIIRDYLDAVALTVIRAQKENGFPIYFNAVPDDKIPSEITNTLLLKHFKNNGKFLDQIEFAGEVFHTLSYVFQAKNEDEPVALSVWTTSPLDLNETTWIFLDMAIEACRLRVSTNYIKRIRLTQTIFEAFDAVEDGFIIYDKDLQVIALNKRQRELFPSVSGTLKIGANYEALLRKQLSTRQLQIPDEDGDAWIAERKKQLKKHGYTEEQKFNSGRTIRLTNYKTASGGAVAMRSDITELVLARQKAVENEQLFRALLIGAPIPLIIITGNEIAYANSYADTLFDAEDGQLFGVDVRDFYVVREHRHMLIAKLEQDGFLRDDTLQIKTIQGVQKTTILSANTINYKGEPSYFVSLIDITQMIEIQKALEVSERQNRALNDLTPDALILQVDGKVVFANQSAIRTFKANSLDDLIGFPSIELIAPQQRDHLMAFRDKVLTSGKPESLKTRYQRFNGDIFHVELYAQSVIWNGQEGTLNFIRDITERQEYEHQILQSEREMGLAQTIGKFGHWRIDLNKQEVHWSKELFHIHGRPYSDTHLSPQQASSYIFPEDVSCVLQALTELSKTGQSQTIPMRITRNDGVVRYLESSMHPELDAIGNVHSVFGVTQDVTERTELEERLRQSQKMEAVGQLTGGIAHDFNNLLAVIQGNAELMEEMLSADEEDKRARLQVILRATDRGADLTSSMLAFGRTQALKPTIIDLNDNVQNMLNVLDRTIEEDISIELKMNPDLWQCFADASQVENAILNLTLNSRDAMPNGGSITLKTDNVHLTGSEFNEAENRLQGDFIILSIEDTGTGIAADKLEHVFEPFYTTKEVGKGTGLGLSMVYGFIKQSNGHIDITSTLGKGTSVNIYLPRSTDL